jgi:hypothetical protein
MAEAGEEGRRFLEEWRGLAEQVGQQLPDWDWGSFLWGVAAGGIITIVVEGVVLFFTWPWIAGFLGIKALAK